MTKIYYESDFKIIERLHKDELKDIPFRYTYFADHAYSASWDGEAYENCKRNPDGHIIVVFNAQSLGLGPLRVKREYFIPDSDFEDGILHKVYVEDTGIVLVSGTGQPVTVEMDVVPPYIYIQEIVDNTTDTSPVKALSANQGRLLRERIEMVSESVNKGLRDEATQRMAADTALGNRITAVTTTANNNKTSLNNLETKFNTNLADLRAKDAELEEAINQEARNRHSEDTNIRGSIETVSNRVATLQTEVSKVKDEVVPQAVAEGIARVVASAPDDLNTLEEIAEYIASDKTEAAKINNAISNLKVATQTNYGEIQQVKHDANGTLGMVLDNSRAIQQHTKDIAKNAEDIANHSKAIDKNAKDVTSNTQAIGLLAETLETKAPKVGYAPDLKVDFAKELVGRGVAEPQEIGNIRPTGVISIGDGNATIEMVKGQSVVWNQWVKDRQSADPTKSPTFIDGVCTIVAEQDIEEGTFFNSLVNTRTISQLDEKWLYTCSDPNVYIGDSWQYGQTPGRYFSNYWFSPKYSVADTHQMGFYFKNGLKAGTYMFTVGIHNLTQMFGAGNEPTTIEEFEARKPLGVSNEYNEGEIISYDGANELKSVGFNAFNGTYAKVIGGEEYHAAGTTSISFAKELEGATTAITLNSENKFIPEEDGYVYAEGKDIVIHLTHSYTPDHVNEYEEDILTLPDVKAIKDKDGNQLFPYGLLSAGRVHDEITATKAVKRIGVVDMGTLSWNWSKNPNWISYLFYAGIITAKSGVNIPSIICCYARHTNINTIFDKSYITGANNKYVYVRDDSYTSVADFKKAMQGVLLYYELAEPIEVDLTEPLNLTYDAWDFGTEELIAEGKTTPLNADIVYQFNAVDRIRENTAKNQALEEDVAQLKAMLTQITQAAESTEATEPA